MNRILILGRTNRLNEFEMILNSAIHIYEMFRSLLMIMNYCHGKTSVLMELPKNNLTIVWIIYEGLCQF